jgi:nuclear transport factor 2 (NTF2) superfamily protein
MTLAARLGRFTNGSPIQRGPERVTLAYTWDSRWRNRSQFLTGRAEIVAFLTRKWARELGP